MAAKHSLALLLFVPVVSIGQQQLVWAGPGDIAEAREASVRFMEQVRRNASTEELLKMFSREAFDNPVTRQIVAFTGGEFDAPPRQIRVHVADALRTVIAANSEPGAACPDRALMRGSLQEGIEPDNDLNADGFALLRLNSKVLLAMQSAPEISGPQIDWLKTKVKKGSRLVVMGLACNHVPISIVWERDRPGQWLIIAFGVGGM